MKKLFLAFLREEDGQDLVEYALVVATVALVLISAVNNLSQGIVSLYESMTGDLQSIGTTGQ
jgi:Flp pilus assembly pilin Flp